ncbi:GNAT family N-acetyltransferase [Flagellimonas sp. DF-77]|uniref:GNAT family N-acetyltransferase n=1 Tax=Flagellimonas algarum TaxID=3230298 RepID=UPI00339825D2
MQIKEYKGIKQHYFTEFDIRKKTTLRADSTFMSATTIRLATQEDAPTIALLGRITFTETFGHLFEKPKDLADYLERTFAVAKIESSLEKTHNVFWLAHVDRLPVGFAKLKLHSQAPFQAAVNSCQLQKIYVLRDFLALKIGTALQDRLLQKAKALGFENVWLSVLKSNERAIRFYHKNGFEPIGEHDFQIGSQGFDFSAMAKTL